MQRGLLSNFGQEGPRNFNVGFGSPPTVGLTTGCSGLAALAAEPCIVRPPCLEANVEVTATCTLTGVSLGLGAYDQWFGMFRAESWFGGAAWRAASRSVSVYASISDVRHRARRH